MTATAHTLKSQPQFFEKTLDGTKPFEIRKNDRNYQVGDVLVLREWHSDSETYSGREAVRTITYITGFGQSPGWVVLGLREC